MPNFVETDKQKEIICLMELQGVPKKMSFSEKEAYLAKGHFFGTPGMLYCKSSLSLSV